jgi:hypothetical protein
MSHVPVREIPLHASPSIAAVALRSTATSRDPGHIPREVKRSWWTVGWLEGVSFDTTL